MNNKKLPSGTFPFLLLLILLTVLSGPVRAGEGSYIIREGDVLEITVWKNPELSREVRVRPDGNISLPLVNDIEISGHIPEEARVIITEKLAGFVNSPNVSVSVSQAVSYRVYTLGALATNGMVQLTAPMTVVQLLARAGGPSPDADLSRAVLIRGNERIPVDLARQIDEGGESSQQLSPGDVLMVPSRRVDVQRVLMVGEVNSPQSMPFSKGMTVLDAYLAAGGGTVNADLESIKVARRNLEGETLEIPVNMDGIIKRGNMAQNITLLHGDIVVVPFRKVDVQRVLVLGEVQTPSSIPFQEGMTVLDAYVEAGGGNEFAKLSKARIIRRKPGGDKNEIRVNLDRIMKKGDLAGNVNLLPGDIVVIP